MLQREEGTGQHTLAIERPTPAGGSPVGRLVQSRAYHRATAWLLWLFILGNGAGSIVLWIDAGGLDSTRSSGEVPGVVVARVGDEEVELTRDQIGEGATAAEPHGRGSGVTAVT